MSTCSHAQEVESTKERETDTEEVKKKRGLAMVTLSSNRTKQRENKVGGKDSSHEIKRAGIGDLPRRSLAEIAIGEAATPVERAERHHGSTKKLSDPDSRTPT